MNRLLVWLAAPIVLLLGCARPQPVATGYTVLSKDLSELRSLFNSDSGKVRAIFLAAPT